MRTYLHYGDEDAEVEAEIESLPARPIPDAHFREICGLVRLAIVGAVAVALVVVAGNWGLLFDGGTVFGYGVYRLLKEA